MPDLTLPFILSQVAMFISMVFGFLCMLYKKREHTILCWLVSCILISAHYFLLNKTAAGVLIAISVLRLITCYFTTNKKYLFIFIALNTISLFFTYKTPSDLIIYAIVTILIISNFQKDNRLMRKLMIGGTSMSVVYSAIIFTPMGIIADGVFLIGGFIGYYRHYIKPSKKSKSSKILNNWALKILR